MEEQKSPTWLRIVDIIFGVVSIMASVGVLSYRELTISTLVMVLSVVLLIIGFARLLSGLFSKDLSDSLRAINVGTGMFALLLAGVTIFYPQLATQMVIVLLAFALLINGLARAVIGTFARIFPSWFRGLLVLVGLFTIVLSFVVLISPEVGSVTLIYLLSISFLINGATRIVSGITGKRKKQPNQTIHD